MNKIFKLAAILLLAYSCGGKMQKNEQTEQARKEVPEAVVSVDSISANLSHEFPKYFFKLDQEIFDSTKAHIDRNQDKIWEDILKVSGINAEKPYITVKHADPHNPHLDLAYWKEDSIFFLVGKKDSSDIVSKMYNSLEWDYDFFKSNLDYTIRHEIGHHLFNTRAKCTGTGERWGAENNFRKEEKLAFQLISEGVAEYFAHSLSDNTLNNMLNLEEYEKKENIYDKLSDSYRAGYSLVKPIIDKYGLKGIDYLAKHPIKSNELSFITLYQKMCLYNLDLEEKVSKLNKGSEDKIKK